ncbi:hypothetical protein OG943_09490 [Amycolatopsis sp. NBC_00345]|uniref:hypothetical protein n=1 Tax=Amycolatopsis sp. NBC_00345 TaxID=2975955 RepID=UPI002E25F269
MPAETRFLPAAGDLALADPSSMDIDGRYTVRPGRCVTELTTRLFGIRWPHARLTVDHAVFTVSAEGATLAVELATASLRTPFPLPAKVVTGQGGLCAGESPSLGFTSDEVRIQDGVHITGRVAIGDSARDLVLDGELRHPERGHVILWLRGTLPPPRRPLRTGNPIVRLLARRPIRVEFAAEFVR